ncbi:type II toxin-antitoxin system RelE/ParE family toxin [soil metagenome]
MIRRLELSDLAEADLAEVFDWYERCLPGLTAGLALCVEETLDRIAHYPESYPLVFRNIRRVPVRRFPYNILYRLHADRIEILAIFHTRRNSTVWQGRG